MSSSAATVSVTAGLALFFVSLARDVAVDTPIHAIGGSHLFALLCLVIGLVQERILMTGRWPRALTWTYVIGLFSYVVLHDLAWESVPPLDWRIAYVPMGVMTLSLVGVAAYTFRELGGAELAVRIYVVGGLLVCSGFLILLITAGTLALGLGGIAGFNMASFWYPVSLVLAMASICFGLFPAAVRPKASLAVCYVIGAVLLSFGTLWATNASQVVPGAYSLMLPGLALMFPSFAVAIIRLLRYRVPGPEKVV